MIYTFEDKAEMDYQIAERVFVHQMSLEFYLSSGEVFKRQWDHVATLNIGSVDGLRDSAVQYIVQKAA